MICWSCERAAGDGATCGACGALQMPDSGADHFRVLGLPRRFALDLGQAEARFRELSRSVHPDRFAKADPRARRASLQRTVQLNEAWRTLKDPVRRAEYLLAGAGYEVGAETGASKPAPAGAAGGAGPGGRERMPVPPALLGEVLELREELGQAREAGDGARVEAMARDLRARVTAALDVAATALEPLEAGDVPPPAAWERAAGALVAIRYFRRLLEEIATGEEEAAGAGDALGA